MIWGNKIIIKSLYLFKINVVLLFKLVYAIYKFFLYLIIQLDLYIWEKKEFVRKNTHFYYQENFSLKFYSIIIRLLFIK